MYQIDAFKGPYFHEEFLKIYTILLYELGVWGWPTGGVGLYACIRACTRVCARSDFYPNANAHVRGVHTGVWVIVYCNNY